MNSSRLTPMGRRIHAGMATSGYSNVAQLARKVGVSRQTVRRWLYDPNVTPTAVDSFALSDALHLSARWIVTGLGEPTPREPLLPNEKKLLCRYRELDGGGQTILLHAAAHLRDAITTA